IQIATQKNAREQNTHGRHYGPPPVALPAAAGLAISPLSESQRALFSEPEITTTCNLPERGAKGYAESACIAGRAGA
ncbi:MAG: hypothetical protein WC130_09045, partial [Kiritimatiellia bacterium]